MCLSRTSEQKQITATAIPRSYNKPLFAWATLEELLAGLLVQSPRIAYGRCGAVQQSLYFPSEAVNMPCTDNQTSRLHLFLLSTHGHSNGTCHEKQVICLRRGHAPDG